MEQTIKAISIGYTVNNNPNNVYLAYTSRNTLNRLDIMTMGYVYVENSLILLLHRESDDSHIYLSEYIYNQLQQPDDLQLRKCQLPCKPYQSTDSGMNLLPDFPLAKQIKIKLFPTRNQHCIDASTLKGFITKPFIAKQHKIIALTLDDPKLLQQFKELDIPVGQRFLKRHLQFPNPLKDSMIYFQIQCDTLNSQYFIVDLKKCNVQLDPEFILSRLPKQTLNLPFQDRIFNSWSIKSELESIIALQQPMSIVIETEKNLGKRMLFKQVAIATGLSYVDKDIAVLSSIKHIDQFLNKQIQPSLIYLRNITFLQTILQLKTAKVTTTELQQYIVQISQQCKKHNHILIITLPQLKGMNIIKSSFDFVLTFKPINDQQVVDVFVQEFHVQEESFREIIKHIPWRLVVKEIQKNPVDYLKQLEARSKSQSIAASTKMEDIGGMEEAINEVAKTIMLPQLYPEIFDDLVKPRRGILFFGPPGTGKTLLAKCIATELKMNFISVKGPEMLNMYIGESEQNIRDLFMKAKAHAPCLVFFDELDALAPARGNQSDSNQVMDRIVAQLLTEVDNLPEGVFIIGATNRPDLLDPALLRPGRFDKLQYLGIKTDLQSRAKILQAQTKSDRFTELVDEIPLNFTGADFYGLTSQAMLYASKREIDRINQLYNESNQQLSLREFAESINAKVQLELVDLRQALLNVVPSVSEADLQKYEELRVRYK